MKIEIVAKIWEAHDLNPAPEFKYFGDGEDRRVHPAVLAALQAAMADAKAVGGDAVADLSTEIWAVARRRAWEAHPPQTRKAELSVYPYTRGVDMPVLEALTSLQMGIKPRPRGTP
jgi:hypothetical protein